MPSLTPVDIVSRNYVGLTNCPTLVSDMSKKWNKRYLNQWPKEGSFSIELIRTMQGLIEIYRADQISGKQREIRQDKRRREKAIIKAFLDQAESRIQDVEAKEVTPPCEITPTPSDSCHPVPTLTPHKSNPSAKTGLETLNYRNEEKTQQEYICRRDQFVGAEEHHRVSTEPKMDRDSDSVGENQQKFLLETLISVGQRLDTHQETCDYLTNLLSQLSDTGAELKVTYNETILQLKKLGVLQGGQVICQADRYLNVDRSNQMDLGDRWRKAEDRPCHSELSRGVNREESLTWETTYPAVIQAPVIARQPVQVSPETIKQMACTGNNLPKPKKGEYKGMDTVQLEPLGENENPKGYVNRAYEIFKKDTGKDVENDPIPRRFLREKIHLGLPRAVQDRVKEEEVPTIYCMEWDMYVSTIDHYVESHRKRVSAQREEDEERARKLMELKLRKAEREEKVVEEEKMATQATGVNSLLWPTPVMAGMVDQQVAQPVFIPPAVNQYTPNQHVYLSSYHPFNNRKRRRISDDYSGCHNCGERTHFWRQCDKGNQMDTTCPPWRRGPRQKEKAVGLHQMGLLYRQADNWRS